MSAKDSAGVLGTGSIVISIVNVPPDITILNPENDGGYSSRDNLAFKVKVIDYEDGDITAPEQIKWYSDIDGLIGSGTSFVNNSLMVFEGVQYSKIGNFTTPKLDPLTELTFK